MNLKTKLYLLLYVPMTFVFVAIGIVLYLAGTRELMIASFGIYISALIVSRIFFESFIKKMFKTLEQLNSDIETVTFTSNLLNHEVQSTRLQSEDFDKCRKVLSETKETLQVLNAKSEAFNEVYGELKNLLITSMQMAEKEAPVHGKAHLTIARELGRVCAETRNKTYNFNDLISSSMSKVAVVSEKMMGLQESIEQSDRPLIISENIRNKTTRLSLHLSEFGMMKKNKSDPIQKVPLRSGSLRKAIKLAEKRAA